MNIELDEKWTYSVLRREIYCPHGVGHPVPWSDKETHGCDGCCGEEKFEEKVEELEKIRGELEEAVNKNDS